VRKETTQGDRAVDLVLCQRGHHNKHSRGGTPPPTSLHTLFHTYACRGSSAAVRRRPNSITSKDCIGIGMVKRRTTKSATIQVLVVMVNARRGNENVNESIHERQECKRILQVCCFSSENTQRWRTVMLVAAIHLLGKAMVCGLVPVRSCEPPK
jgi:hypothetical protein